jgi:hypothetical protein
VNPNRNTIATTLLLAAAWALAASTARSQDHLGVYRPLTLAPADASSFGGGGAGDDEKAQKPELVKKSPNPVASLVSVPIYVEGPSGGLKWSFRFGVTLLFPK